MTKTDESAKTQTPGPGRGPVWAVAAFVVVLAVAGIYLATSGDDDQVAEPTPTTVAPALYTVEPVQFAAPFAIPEPVEGFVAGGDFSFVHFTFDGGRTLVLTTSGPSSVQAWLDDLASQSGATTTEPIDINVGGISAIFVDVEVSDATTLDSCGSACEVLFEHTWGYERKEGGTHRRLLLLDVHGETVAIIANAPIGTFDEWWGEVENLLQDLVWLGP